MRRFVAIALSGLLVIGVLAVGASAWALLEQRNRGGVGAGSGSAAPAVPTSAAQAGTGPIAADASGALRADPAWVAETAAATGIPERALGAYAAAAFAASEEFPGCGIGWNTLAGIGYAETIHGSLGGGGIDADGVVRPSVRGPALDGTAFDAIPDTDGGALDGDPEWERAVGPMQFLPQTWAHYGAGIGAGDINSIDDAAHAAARMLCDIGGDLTIPENWIAAVDGYNPNVAYNNEVAEWADRYAQLAP